MDLTFVSCSLLKGSHSWAVMNTYTASDHTAILWEVTASKNPRRTTRQTNTVGWKVKAFDPATFLVALDSDPIITESAEEKAKELMKRVIQACDACMPPGNVALLRCTGGTITLALFVQSVSEKEECLSVDRVDLTL